MNGIGRDVDNTFPGLHFDIEELSSCGAGGVIVIFVVLGVNWP